jgi:hypothetical protein
MLLLTATLVLCSLPSAVLAEKDVSVTSNEITAMCRGLKPFNNLDELVHQIYINLNDDCLFKMNPKKLAEIWHIPTIVYTDTNNPSKSFIEEKKSLSKDDHDYLALLAYGVDINTGSDDFFILVDIRKKANAGPLFPGEKNEYPSFLPESLICGATYSRHPHRLWWLSSDKKRIMVLMGGYGLTQHIKLFKPTSPMPFVNCH